MYLTSFDGVIGNYEKDGESFIVRYKTCVPQVRDCEENRQSVHEADLSTYKKSMYFDAFINSFSVMHTDIDETSTKEATIKAIDKDLKPLDIIRPQVYDTMMALEFRPIESATFNNSIIVKGNGSSLVVRNNSIVVPRVLTVFKGTRECTQQVDIGGITVMKYEANNFNFYQYGDSLIKIGKEYNVDEYIELKTIK